ncbi:MAG: Transcriptional regulator, contains XRE-family domain [Amycolatopsis sp.]|jgi:transcriptional regulator with XRE-family HTH domain|uniref:helix-turn-helix domain-containing protein n=1 Tax=Amycolatopsis sp. TaxID=37632 RepID=UPI00261ACAC2|nr:helix-turn-helix transcriptional regulator [Amycolatopsis sp.]MCU1680918.1 Transcriptional regulator, contains XRE-family domain [Amycolatopsis sp.]
MAGTTPKSRALGAELRKAREAVDGLSVRAMALRLGYAHPTVSRWETGDRTPSEADVAAFLTVADAPVDVRQALVEMSRDTDAAHWLSVGMPEQQGQLSALLEIERTAQTIVAVSPLLIPGLLQAGPYARAVMIAAEVPREEIDLKVAVRVGRRESITRKEPVELRAFLWEPVLLELIGGEEVMLEQLAFLLEMGERSNVELRVIPTRTTWHPGLEGPFSIAQFADRGSIVHLENKISGLFLHEPNEVGPYERALNRVEEVAMSPTDTAELIADVIKGKETTR